MAERDVILKRFSGGTTWDVLYPKTKVTNVDGLYNRLKDSPYYVEGTGTTTGTWLGTIDGLTSYYDGLMINYKIPVAGASTTTLNINGLGARTVRRSASASVTTHLPVNSIMPLVYTTINGVGYFLWADYDSTRGEISEANIINKTSSTISAISGRRLEYFLTNTTNARAVGWDNKEPAFSKNTAFNKNFGTTEGTVTQGNDSRLSDARASNDVSSWAKSGSSSKIPTSKLPALAITDTFEVATQSAMTNLTAQKGDIAIRTDLNKTFILAAEPASTLGNWKELKTPTDAVLSVAGLTGAITSSSLKTSLSLNDVENKSSATIRGEITSANVTSALGFTPAKSSHSHDTATPSSHGFMSVSDKNRLDSMDYGAQVNVGTNLSLGTRNATALRIDSSTGSGYTIPSATTSYAGLMTSADKTKLDSIDTGAPKNRVELLRARSDVNNLTIHNNATVTGVGSKLNLGDTIMFEVLNTGPVTVGTPKILTATVSTTSNSASDSRSVTFTTWTGSEMKVFSLSVALASGALTFGNMNVMIMSKSGTDMNITNSVWYAYIGRIWKVDGSVI